MIVVKKYRHYDRKAATASLALSVLLFALFVLFIAPFTSSALVGALFGGMVLGPLVGVAMRGKPALRITNGEKTCDLIYWYDVDTPVLSVLEDGYSSRELRLKEPIETAVCDIPIRAYLTPTKLGTTRVVVEIEGERYYLP
ncbi:hypothetical protein A3L09_02330 [Thermococcus profundus]|uniref:Uncharacterized protein n=1 Tax=Thermococcus profundus TaxID=49899 RepID=A0A2Z2MC94_THEPR|nr:hypothetical protein [Thermococcus profundus]ASJ02185.1 hypothetical protein A3L09_02330 [Thermococcus profundus]